MANRKTTTDRPTPPCSLPVSRDQMSTTYTERAGFIEDPNSELLDALRRRAAEAFSTLIRLHERRLLRTALKITGNREDAEDAVQNTFLQVYRNIDGFRGDCQFTSWLTRILINQSLMQLRRRKNLTVSIDDCAADGTGGVPFDIKASCRTPEESFLENELSERLIGALRKLRVGNRGVAELHYLKQLSTEEIASEMRISIPAAKSRLLRARKQLRRDGPKQVEPPNPASSARYGRTQILAPWNAVRSLEQEVRRSL